MKVLNVDPSVLKQAADGINGVISGISGGAFGSYEGQLGRGFSDLALSGMAMSHADAKAGFDDFLQRWEWGTRALIVAASDIGSALDLGAGRYELQEDYFADAGKDMLNDLAGDPSLQKQSVRDADGNILVRGTDDMSFGDVVDYNVNRLANPDWSEQSFNEAMPQINENLDAVVDNSKQAAINAVVPGGVAMATVDGFMADDAPPAPVPQPAIDPAQ